MIYANPVFLVAVLVVVSPNCNYFSGTSESIVCLGAEVDTGNSDTEIFITPPSTSSTSLVANTTNTTFMISSSVKEELEAEFAKDHSTCPAFLQGHCEGMKMETEITVITLNCWGIRFISKDRAPRMDAIAEELATGRYDFVFLQEVWTTEDYERIKVRTGDVLPYSHYFYSGVIGAGICIFSKSPIKSAFFHQWAVNGYMHKVQHGDWFGGKGIGMVQVYHRGLKINLYTAHLHAEYDRRNDMYLAHRVTQAFDTAKFISVTSQDADVVIVGGDLNTEPGDLAYRIIVNTAELLDACEEAEKKPPNEFLNTCETHRNSYASAESLKENPHGKRIDYIVYRGGTKLNVKPLTCETPLPDRVPGQPFSYSDHEAVVSRIRITKSNNVVTPRSFNLARRSALEESVTICNQYMKELHTTKTMYMFMSLAMIVLLSLTVNMETTGCFVYLIPVIRIVVLLLFFFGGFMSIIWHRMELHGILSGKLGMLIELGRPLEPEAQVVPPTDSLVMPGAGETWTDVNPSDCLP